MASNSAARVARVYDQHGQFMGLEGSLFSLSLPDTYLQVRGEAGGAEAAGAASAAGVVTGCQAGLLARCCCCCWHA